MKAATELIERLVDEHTLAGVVEMLSDICSEKAAHIRAHWQDCVTASSWDDAAQRLETAAIAIEKLGV